MLRCLPLKHLSLLCLLLRTQSIQNTDAVVNAEIAFSLWKYKAKGHDFNRM